jgi:plasmid stabilization system protein ParE
LAFQIDLTESALIDAEEYVRFIRDNKKETAAAERWFRGLVQAIYSLEEMPLRCPVIPEQDEFAIEIRHLIYYSHRIIFHVDVHKGIVVIYRIFHGSRLRLTI